MCNNRFSPKVNIPYNTAELTDRPRLYSLLHNNRRKKVTIVRAPAGYGKTTLILQWLTALKEPIAWFAIERDDSDPIRFWTYVTQAVANAWKTDIDVVLEPLLHSQDDATYDFLIDSFLHELYMQKKPLHIVLDDYHLIENEKIQSMLTKFINQLPPYIHVYLTTRTAISLPVAKWRVNQWVQEINTDQLRFTFKETTHFFTLKELTNLDEEQIKQILNKTEGWIAGLLLMQLSAEKGLLLEQNQMEPFITEFLWEEIIHKLPQDVQNFLLQTSLLRELEPTICDKLTGRTDSVTLLSQFEDEGIFTVRLQGTNPVFRYHHLFIEALQIELMKQFSREEICTIAKKAAQLLYDYGDITSAIDLAIKYDFYELAQQWIIEHLYQFCKSGQMETYMRWLHILRTNLEAVDLELLIIGYSYTITTLDWETAHSITKELDARHEVERWMEQEEFISLADIYNRIKAYAIIAARGNLGQVKSMLSKQLTRPFNPLLRKELQMVYNTFEYKLLRTSLAGKGNMPSLEETPIITHLFQETDFKQLYVTAFITGIAAEVYYERNEFKLAKKNMENAIQFGHEHDDASLFVPMYLLKAKIYAAQNQMSSAHAILIQALEHAKEKHWQITIKIMQAYCYIQEGNIHQAEMLLAATQSWQPFWLLVNARLLLLMELPEQALQTIVHVKMKAQNDKQIATLLEATVLEAVCHMRLQHKDIAMDVLHEALQLAANYYYVRTLLDEKELLPLLREYLQLDDVKQRWNIYPTHYFELLQKQDLGKLLIEDLLTARELEVFELLVSGLKNREIADKLDLSEGTVRIYLSTIYRKLGVNSRTQAILLKDKVKIQSLGIPNSH